jgi:ATP-dependent RNA helicase DDX5/DBP2
LYYYISERQQKVYYTKTTNMGRRGSRRTSNKSKKRKLSSENSQDAIIQQSGTTTTSAPPPRRLEVSFWANHDEDEDDDRCSNDEDGDDDGHDHHDSDEKSQDSTIPPPLTLKDSSDNNDNNKEGGSVDDGPIAVAWRRLQQQRNHNCSFTSPTLIQAQTWACCSCSSAPPRSDVERNLLLIAPTGSGKTLAYGLPLVASAASSLNPAATTVVAAAASRNSLVLVPTRELALQVQKQLRAAGGRVVACYGGVDRDEQLRELSFIVAVAPAAPSCSSIVAATTGRFLDLWNANERVRSIVFSSVVLDEADRLASNADLCQQVDAVLAGIVASAAANKTEKTAQIRIFLCSATFPQKVSSVWRKWIDAVTSTTTRKRSPILIKVDGMSVQSPSEEMKAADENSNRAVPSRNIEYSKIPSNLTQTLHVCAEHKKPKKLLHILGTIRNKDDSRNPSLGIIFCSKIKTVQYLYQLLRKERAPCTQLHSQLTQSQREQSVRDFSSGKRPMLLATDIAARGLHMNHIQFVVQYDFPSNLEQYIHRCGRAGRDGKTAVVYSFFTRNLAPLANDVVALLEAANQHVDPNLRALMACKKEARGVPADEDNFLGVHRQKQQHSDQGGTIDNVEDTESDDDFKYLAPNRIVLKRASHVSDASENELSSDED